MNDSEKLQQVIKFLTSNIEKNARWGAEEYWQYRKTLNFIEQLNKGVVLDVDKDVDEDEL